jgi:hypothetical protein
MARVTRRASVARCLLVALAAAAVAATPLPPQYASVSVITARPPDARLVDAASFGAVGDGVADDTLALQRAINSTYGAALPDCTAPGARLVALEGDGKVYRLTAPLRLWIWTRLVGFGAAARPVLLLGAATPGFANASAPQPLALVLDYAPAASGSNCFFNPVDGGNTAFGVGILNVDVEVRAGNPGAVGVRNRAAQGGVLRAMRFSLAPDVLAGVLSPGWAHQELVVLGGRAGVVMADTGAWPAIFRDSAFVGQTVAGVAWADALTARGANSTSPWIGLTCVRCYFADAPVAVSARRNATAGTASARISILESAFVNISAALVDPPALAAGASSVLVRGALVAYSAAAGIGGGGAGGAGAEEAATSEASATVAAAVAAVAAPVIMLASDFGPAVAAPPAAGGEPAFLVRELVAGAVNTNVSDAAPGGAAVTVTVLVDAAAVAAAPNPLAPPPPDTPPFAPVARWVSVKDHGAAGDGAHDDAPALNALLAAAAAAGTPSAIFFPQGIYLLNSTLVVPPAAAPGARLHLFGLSCWDVVLALADAAPGFGDPAAMRPVVDVLGGGGGGGDAPWISGLNIRSGMTWPGGASPNPGAIGLQWRAAAGGGAQDLFMHPATFPDNSRDPSVPNTELSLVVRDGGGGVFADLWSCNSYSQGGVRIVDTAGPATFYQLSSEHHAGHELWLTNATNVAVHCMQTEDRSPDAAPTSSVRAEGGSRVIVTGLFSYYAASVASAAACVADDSSSLDVAVFRQYHSYHPLYYVCSLLKGAACVQAVDFALARTAA